MSYIPLPTLPPLQPPAFDWEGWYGAVGGRSIDIPDVTMWMQRIRDEQYPRFEGPVSSAIRRFDSGDASAAWVTERARTHGADIVGICRVEESDVYRGRTVPHRYAIVVGARMHYDAFVTVPSDDAAVECMRVYHALGETVISLAEDLRANGHACTIEHPIGDSSVLHVPLALKAGFGELGRHGSIIHPEYGPLFRIGSVLTDLDLTCNTPIDVGIGAFCDHCKACRMFCPADAIPDERSPHHGTDPLGNARYVIDTGKCFPYFATAKYCSACLATCAYQHKRWARMHDGTIGHYPDVPFGTVPPSVDPPVTTHPYPKLRRGMTSPHHRTDRK